MPGCRVDIFNDLDVRLGHGLQSLGGFGLAKGHACAATFVDPRLVVMSNANVLMNRASVWSAYWRSGALPTCAGSHTSSYGGIILDFWQKLFAKLDAHA
jgi:hypothetical protein